MYIIQISNDSSQPSNNSTLSSSSTTTRSKVLISCVKLPFTAVLGIYSLLTAAVLGLYTRLTTVAAQIQCWVTIFRCIKYVLMQKLEHDAEKYSEMPPTIPQTPTPEKVHLIIIQILLSLNNAYRSKYFYKNILMNEHLHQNCNFPSRLLCFYILCL